MASSPTLALTTELVPISSISLDPANVNQHPERSIQAIKGSLARFGQVEPLIVHDGVVIGGNGRLVAMQQLGWTHCSIHRFQGTRSEATALAIALNRSAQFSEFDEAALSEQLEALAAEGFDLNMDLGFSEEDLAAISHDDTQGASSASSIKSDEPRPFDKVWVLIGCPVAVYGKIQPLIDQLSQADPSLFLEMTVGDHEHED